MGCTVSTDTVSSIWPGDRRSKKINSTDAAIEHHDVCEDRSNMMTSAFTLQQPDVIMPLIANIEEAKVVEEKLSSMQQDQLYADRDFPADGKVLYYSVKPVEGVIEWKRPYELVDEPMMQVDGAHRNDIMQGVLGDCWFLSSCIAVSQQSQFMDRVIPGGQPLFGEGYKGAVKFKFWRFGEWITVYIDDRLPTVNGQLIYAKSSNNKEFWVSLIEKAYAKLHGCYESIGGGQSMDALVDLTSGLAERYDLEDHASNNLKLFRYLFKASKYGALITCSRKGDWKAAITADPNGLVSGHAYTVTFINRVESKSQGAVNLLRIKNPWGDGTEWNGAWCDSDSIWDEVDEQVKNDIQYKNSADGEFWMTMDDFCKEFEEVSICTIGPDYDGDGVADRTGYVKAIKGQWIPGHTAGGCRNNIDSFANNPQYSITLKEPDESGYEGTNRCSIVVALMQENRRTARHLGVAMLQIGFVIYQVTKAKHKMKNQYFAYHHDSGTSGPYINYREVIGRFDLSPGQYVIVPATFEPDAAAQFMIRVYSEKPFALRELML